MKKISMTYTDDLNLFHLNSQICMALKTEQDERLKLLNTDLALLKAKLPQCKFLIEKKAIEKNINETEQEINKLQQKLNNYIKETEPFLKQYQQYGPSKKILSFRSNRNNKVVNEILISPKTKLIHDFIQIGQKYIDLHIVRELNIGNSCPGCNADLTDIEPLDESGLIICPNCKHEKYTFIKQTIETATSSNSSLDTLCKSLMKFQGKHPTVLPPNIYKDLDQHFTSYGLPFTSKEIKALPLNDNGTRGETTREIMLRALRDKGYATYYEDLNLICHQYWGWELPNIQDKEEIIIRDIYITEEILKMLPSDLQINLNSQYRLYKLFQLRKLSYNIEYFKIISTRSIITNYDNVWREIINKAKELYPDLEFEYYDTI